jgi:hypothetical protein
VSVCSVERLYKLDAVVSTGSRGITSNENHDELEESKGYPARWIRRLDVQLKLNADAYKDNSPAAKAVSRILQSCTRLEVFKSDIEIQGEDCARTPQPVLSALENLPNLRRLDFAGHEGPSLGDYITLIPHLSKLEQLRTGRIAEPVLTDDQITEEIRMLRMSNDSPLQDHDAGTGMSTNTNTSGMSDVQEARGLTEGSVLILPSLRALQIPRGPLNSCLRVFNLVQLPSLTYLAHYHIDFHHPRTINFFAAIGKQLTHVYTSGVRTPGAPWGSARLLAACPNLLHLSYTPRLKDENYERSWQHENLRSVGVLSILPKSMPPRQELAINISRSITDYLRELFLAKRNGQLPNLEVVRLEDGVDSIHMEYIRQFGLDWLAICQGLFVLEDGAGQRIVSHPSLFASYAFSGTSNNTSKHQDKVNPVVNANGQAGSAPSNGSTTTENRSTKRAIMMKMVSPVFNLWSNEKRSPSNDSNS